MNLKELAAHLGLSPTTVSRALADYDDVARATDDRVRRTAATHGYQPNTHARFLATGRTNTVAVILTPSAGGTGSEAGYQAMKLACETLKSEGYESLVVIQDAEGGIFGARFLQVGTVDGVLLLSTIPETDVEACLKTSGLPFARLSGTEERSPTATFLVDVSRFCAAPSARLSHFPFESDGAFPAQR